MFMQLRGLLASNRIPRPRDAQAVSMLSAWRFLPWVKGRLKHNPARLAASPHAHLLGRHGARPQIGQAFALRHRCQDTLGINGGLQNMASVRACARKLCSAPPALKCAGRMACTFPRCTRRCLHSHRETGGWRGACGSRGQPEQTEPSPRGEVQGCRRSRCYP